jgi:hypothetical protein
MMDTLGLGMFQGYVRGSFIPSPGVDRSTGCSGPNIPCGCFIPRGQNWTIVMKPYKPGRGRERERPQHTRDSERVEKGGKRDGENPKGVLPRQSRRPNEMPSPLCAGRMRLDGFGSCPG